MSTLTYACRCCGARVWSMDRDVAARIRARASLCNLCDADAADDVRARFGAVVRREAARVAPVEPLPSALGFVLAGCVVLAVAAVVVAPFAVEAFTVGAIVAGIAWFAQLAGRFLA